MGLMKKKRCAVPEGCEGMEIKVISSTCTGEKVIGFYDRKTRELRYSELVESERDIKDFYERYGLSYNGQG